MKPTEPCSSGDRTRVWRPSFIPGLEVGVRHSPVALEFPPSIVFDYRIVLNGHGRSRVRFGSQSYRIEDVRGVVFLQHPNDAFHGSFDGPDGASGACLSLSKDLVAGLHGEEPGRRWRFPRMVPFGLENAILAGLTRAALQALQESTPMLEQQSRLLALIQAAMRSSAAPADALAWVERPRGSERRAVSAAQRYFGELPGLDHSMHDLALLTGLNPRYLIRVFQQQTGLTPHRYLTALRVHRPKDLLLTDQPLKSVAADLGFSDQRTFQPGVQDPRPGHTG